MHDTQQTREKFILICVSKPGDEDPDILLDELEELVETAGGTAVGRIIQNRESESVGSYIGKGKIEEALDYAKAMDADGVVCDDELSPAQMRALSDALSPLKVLDRTMVILDIFADHASSNEGKLEVELAILKYRAARLRSLAGSYDRQGYGVGQRGPGEKKLETDRRRIRERIAVLSGELKESARTREVTRSLRTRKNMPLVSIVGYTNAGKSTLLNALTGAGVLEEDKLFATLDTTVRSHIAPSGQEILFSDTVGFIRKLPHHLVDAFRSTLDEALGADIIIHVIDASDSDYKAKTDVVYETLDKLGAAGKPVIAVFNKTDLVPLVQINDPRARASVRISALKGEGLDRLVDAVEEILLDSQKFFEGVLPYDKGSDLAIIRTKGRLLTEEYIPEGVKISAYVPAAIYNTIKEFDKT